MVYHTYFIRRPICPCPKWFKNIILNNINVWLNYYFIITGYGDSSSGVGWLKGVKELGFGPANSIVHLPDEDISLHLVMKVIIIIFVIIIYFICFTKITS